MTFEAHEIVHDVAHAQSGAHAHFLKAKGSVIGVHECEVAHVQHAAVSNKAQVFQLQHFGTCNANITSVVSGLAGTWHAELREVRNDDVGDVFTAPSEALCRNGLLQNVLGEVVETTN